MEFNKSFYDLISIIAVVFMAVFLYLNLGVLALIVSLVYWAFVVKLSFELDRPILSKIFTIVFFGLAIIFYLLTLRKLLSEKEK